MSNQVPTHYVQQFNSGVRMLQQQMDSRLRSAVLVDNSVVGDRAFYDQVDAVSMSEIQNRHGDTEYTETPHKRRMVTMTPFEVADLVDRVDRRRLLNDPVNPYTRAFAAAANRKLDDIILGAFDATASTGVDGTGTAAFDTAFSFTEVGGAGTFDFEDLLKARRLLEAAENMEDDGEYAWNIVMSARCREFLLQRTEVTSADYNTVKALVNGQINTYLGLNFIKSQRADIDASDVRDVYVWVKSSMRLAVSQDATSFMDVLPGKRHSIQVRYELDAGATRMDEKGVVRILVDET